MPGTLGVSSSSRVRLPLPITNFGYSSAGNGDNKQVTFTWSNTPNNNDLIGHRVNIYNSSNTLIGYVDSSGPTATSATYTFASPSTVYYARLFAQTHGGYTISTTVGSNSHLKVTTGAASYTVSASWSGSDNSITPTYGSQSRWPGEPFGDFTFHGSKAFDNNTGTYWTGQSWSYDGNNFDDSEWISFTCDLGSGNNKKLLTNVYFSTPSGWNASGWQTLDRLTFPTWTFLSGNTNGPNIFGIQGIPTSYEMDGAQGFRINFTNFGYNPSSFGNYRVGVAEVTITYRDYIPAYTVSATSNSIGDGT